MSFYCVQFSILNLNSNPLKFIWIWNLNTGKHPWNQWKCLMFDVIYFNANNSSLTLLQITGTFYLKIQTNETNFWKILFFNALCFNGIKDNRSFWDVTVSVLHIFNIWKQISSFIHWNEITPEDTLMLVCIELTPDGFALILTLIKWPFFLYI